MNRITILGTLACLVTQWACAQEIDFSRGHWLDLSHAYSEEILYWPTSDTFHRETVFEGHTDGGWYYTAYSFTTAEHGGTHIDAPIQGVKQSINWTLINSSARRSSLTSAWRCRVTPTTR